jgi:Tfp pilus assembly protein PilN
MHLFASRIVIIFNKRKELQMFFILAVVVVLLLLVLAGVDLFVAQYNSDELSNMGVQER